KARRVVVLADESANWKIAGLRQLDRIILALSEESKRGGCERKITILWSPLVPASQRLAPSSHALSAFGPTNVETEMPEDSGAVLLSTRLFVLRNAIGPLLGVAPPMTEREMFWQQCFRDCEQVFRSGQRSGVDSHDWKYLAEEKDKGSCERFLLTRS